jgi:hypothetical protein
LKVSDQFALTANIVVTNPGKPNSVVWKSENWRA